MKTERQIKDFLAAYRQLCDLHGLQYGATCGHDGDSVHPGSDLIIEDDQAVRKFQERYTKHEL